MTAVRTARISILSLALVLAACTAPSTLHPPQPDRASELNLQLGIDALRKGNLAQAKDRIERALKYDSRNAQAHAMAGLLYDRLGEQRKADSHFRRAVSLAPKDSEILNNYAAYLCQNGRYDRGERFALEAAANPLYATPAVALVNAGNCARGGGSNERAEQHFRRALAIDPRMPTALLQMAEIEYAQANYLSARAFLERYLAVGRNDPATLMLGVRIERSLGNADAAREYAERLRAEFPTAKETHELAAVERNPG